MAANSINNTLSHATPHTEFLTPEDISRRLKVKYITVHRLIKNKKIKAIKIGRSVRVHPDWLKEYEEGNVIN